MKNVEGAARRGNVASPRRTTVALVATVVLAMLGTVLTLGFSARDASAVPPAPVDGTVCYSIDEGTGDGTADPQYLHTIKLDSTGVTSYTHSATPVDASGNIENIALRNDAAEVYAYDPAANQMYLIDVTTPAESTPTDFNLTGLNDIDAMFFQNDDDGDPSNDILWTVTDPDTLTGYDTGGNVVAGSPVTVTLTAPDKIEGATWLPDANGGGGEFFVTYVETATGNTSTLASLGTGTTPSSTPSVIGQTEDDVEGLGVDGAGNMYMTTGEDGEDADNLYAVDPTDGSTTLLQDLTSGAPVDGDADFESVDCAYPKVALAKQLTSEPAINAAGNYEMEFTFVIENQGELPLENVTLTDDFDTIFSPGTLVGTPTYDDANGDCSSAAADGTATLNIGESCTAIWQVELQDVPVGDYENTASVTGAAPNGIGDQVSDDSEDAATPSDPEVETVTPVNISEDPLIGLTKEVVSGPTPNGDGTYDITYAFTAHNMGNVPLSDITLTDDYTEFTDAGTVTGPTVTDACTNTLDPGATCSIIHDVTVDVPPGSYDNSATVSGTSPDSTQVTDVSNNGLDPDTDDDGITDEPEDNIATTISLAESPAIGLTKQATSGPTENAAGNLEITYTFTVFNTGDVPLSDITLDDTYTAFSDAGTIVSGPTEDSNTCAGGDLAVDGTCEIVQTVEVDVPPGDYDNSATVTGTSPASTQVTDVSNDGVDPDTDDDGITDEPEDNVETTVTVAENAVIGLAKDITSGPTENASGNYDLTYTFTVENLGNSDLTNLDLEDTFSEFAAAGSIVSGPTETSNCPATLPAGDSCTIDLDVEVNVPPGSYDNNGTISATSVGGTNVSDTSTNGVDPDPNGDGNPDEQDPTTVSIGENPVIGLTKQLTSGPTENASGNYDLEFTFTVYNMGDVALTDVSVADDYAEYAAAGSIVSGPTVTTNTCTGTLAVDGTCQIVHSIEVDVPAGSYDNTATATGTSPLDTQVSDVSNDGADPDENDNGDPTDPEDETVTTVNFAEGPIIGLTKQATSGPTVNAAGNVEIQYTFTIYNMGDVALSDVSVNDDYAEFDNAGTIVSGPTEVSNDCPTLLAVGDSCTIVEQIEVDVPAGDYNNTATATGTSPGGVQVTDVSNAGTDPDENDNGDPTDPEDETETTVTVPDPAKATIGDRVWNDLNGNGLQDDGEPGLEGVSVSAYQVDDAGELIDGVDPITTTTDSNGEWSLEIEPDTKYRIQFVKPTGSDGFTTQDVGVDDTRDSDAAASGQTGWTGIYELASGESNDSVDAGVIFPPDPGSISNFVWSDENGNGQQDAGEPGIEGIVVRLLDSAGNQVDTTTTNANGEYSFTDLDPGVYTVQFVNSTTGTFTTPNAGDDATDSDVDSSGSVQVTLGAGEDNDTIDAGIVPASDTGSLSDRVWEDTNQDGIQDAGEPGVSGVLVEVFDSANNKVGDDTTDANGGWYVGNLADDDYTVKFTLPGSREFTAQDAGADDALDSDANVTTGETGTYTITGGANITTVDAGVLPIPVAERGSIADKVWEDTNENGIQDAGEPGVSGVEVILTNSLGATVDSTTTNADGEYILTNLPADDYVVTFVPPATREFTTQDAGADDNVDSDADVTTGETGTITLAAGQNITNVDAGLTPVVTTERGSISNYVWVDADEDGVQDADEVGMPGVEVVLTNGNGDEIGRETTDSDGLYFFGNLPADTYTVTFITPGTTTLTQQDAGADEAVDSDPNPSDGKVVVTLAAGEHDSTIDAGVVPAAVADTGSIANYVWEDTNENGIQDSGEPGVSGVTVTAYNSAGVPVGSSTTGADGQYSIGNLPADTYEVRFNLPGTREFTTQGAGGNTDADSDPDPATGSVTVNLAQGQDRVDIDAGVLPIPEAERGSISNYVWSDTDGDGLQDADENGVAGVVVTVSTASGATVGTDTTDANGHYLVDNLAADNYVVTFDPPGDATFTMANQGSDDVDSDPDPATGQVTVALGEGEHNVDVDAGIVPVDPAAKGSISDRVWQDLDEDGIQDPGEPGVQGATVTVYNSAGIAVGSTQTDGNGAYTLGDLPAGEYTIGVSLPGTMVFTAQDAGDDDDADSDVDPTTGRTDPITLTPGQNVDNVDAGAILNKGSISNVVFRDMNGNGIQDAGEGGVAGVTVQALDADGMVVAEDTTDDNGTYLLTGLEPGTYTVKFILPGDQEFTTANAGSNDELDSDPDPATGITAEVTVAPGSNITHVDAGVLPRSVIGLAKAVSAGPTEASDGSWQITYTFTIENLGDSTVSDIELDDDFDSAFSGATIVSGPSAAGGTCSADAMAGTLELDAGEICTAVLSVWVSGMTQGTVYRNSATVTGTDPSGNEVTDVSDSGSNADPNGNGVPNDSGESDATPVSLPSVTTVTGTSGPVLPYPGPFKVAPPAPTSSFSVPIAEPTEPLAHTGSDSGLLASMAIGLLGAGAALMIGSRRKRDEE